MVEYIREGGVIMYPLLIIALTIVVIAARAWLRLRAGGSGPRVSSGIDAVLFWGAYGVVLGLLGTLVGVAQVAEAIQRAGVRQVSASLIWSGIRVALNPTNFALLLFSAACLLWFALRMRYRRLVGS